MTQDRPLAALAIDLTRIHRRTVSSFYSNLVTRPTGRAVRSGVEQQLAELSSASGFCLSILDFSQVRVMDYSCADEIVAKLLLQQRSPDRAARVYFLARGLHDHHLDCLEAVLERHRLLLAGEGLAGEAHLYGPASAQERRCWHALIRSTQLRPESAEEGTEGRTAPYTSPRAPMLQPEPAGAGAEGDVALDALIAAGVAIRLRNRRVIPLPHLARDAGAQPGAPSLHTTFGESSDRGAIRSS